MKRSLVLMIAVLLGGAHPGLLPAQITLEYMTYLGGSDDNYADGITFDADKDLYITGPCTATNFPVVNAYQSSRAGSYDAVISKFSSSGSTLVYSTYLGGSEYDEGRSIVVNSGKNAFVTGMVLSANFPTANPYQASHGGGQRDIFVTKLSSTGSSLIYSTYLGGSENDEGFGVVIDSADNAYVTGEARSPNFPTANPYQASRTSASAEAIVTKFSSTGSSLIFSTYLGGTGCERGLGITLGSANDAYISGYSSSGNFPTANAYQPSGSGIDAFVSRFSSTGSSLIFSTYLGGNSSDYG